MTITAWTAEQIAALAPDASALSAARKLRGKWSGSGQHETALWGLCQGSGSRPYQTIVDLSGPAYKCSCPSRKFPCKHALSLLLCWSSGEIGPADAIADFAADWLDGRVTRAAKKAAPEPESPRRTASATADQRRARVAAGLADLDTWLTDQIRTGLAQADRSLTAFESVAARMVDAQAPGVAGTLRQLSRVAYHSDWPQLLLREYARLHLLATAHRRLDSLSPALQSTVRAHLGYQTPVESVRTEPALRDTWQVLAIRITTEDSLYTRRTYLHGRTTHRWALLVDHHYGSPTFAMDTPPAGFQLEADLHYYPASSPLRAIWGTRHTLPDPFTTIPRRSLADTVRNHTSAERFESGTGTTGSSPSRIRLDDAGPAEVDPRSKPERPSGIEAALREYAIAMGADPFRRAWPVLLPDVVPVRTESGWFVVESDGSALPVSAADGEPWRLLGLSGGHPVTVIGEWGADGLLPVAAFANGAVVNITAAEGITGRLPAATAGPPGIGAELVSAALIGTGRRAPDYSGLPAPVAVAAARLDNTAAGPRHNSPRPNGAAAEHDHIAAAPNRTAAGPDGATVETDRIAAAPNHAAAGPDGATVETDGRASGPDGVPGAPDLKAAEQAAGFEQGLRPVPGDHRVPADSAEPGYGARADRRDAAAVLLETVALQDCFTRGGMFAGTAELVAVAEDDGRLLLPVAAAGRLGTLLADNSPFLDEWFGAAGGRDFRAPDGLVSVLLERAKALAGHREALLRLAGARGRWLAGQHPGWRTLVRAAVEDQSVWSHGRAGERRMWLAQLRRRNPGAARLALSSSWSSEAGAGKAELLGVLAAGLSLEDEALLESALDDRRAEVRRTAADLLGRLPDSAFAGRMAERAGAWVSFGRRLTRLELTTTGPGVLDDAARRDGVGDSFGYTAYRADGAPDLSGEWLHRVAAATPLAHWERVLGPADKAVQAAMAEGVRGPMFAGWSDAALAQRNPEWARALFDAYAAQQAGEADSEKLRELFAMQPLDDQIRHLQRLDSSWLAEIESLLRALPRPWPIPMAEHVLRLLLERAELCADRPGAPSLVPGSYRTLFRAASAHFPVSVAGTVTNIARKCGDPYWEQAFDQLAHDLIERKTMLEELQ
ncbi:DUF5691 domain-containing protein [Nocardia sp. NPDC020380]|uniref:SWIM zinc finger family protein n=1 Tax=Nocardia sp. NPDC020380 TaxID=3364309 RepID=UPI0037AFC3D6